MNKTDTFDRSNVISPEDFLRLYREIRDTERVKKEAAAAYKAARENAKSAGVDLDALKIVEHLEKLAGEEAELRVRDTLRYSAWLGIEIGTQLDLFEKTDGPGLTDKITGQHKEWRAEQEGYKAANAGEPRDNCPYPAASPLCERWHAGYQDGREVPGAKQEKDSGEPA